MIRMRSGLSSSCGSSRIVANSPSVCLADEHAAAGPRTRGQSGTGHERHGCGGAPRGPGEREAGGVRRGDRIAQRGGRARLVAIEADEERCRRCALRGEVQVRAGRGELTLPGAGIGFAGGQGERPDGCHHRRRGPRASPASACARCGAAQCRTTGGSWSRPPRSRRRRSSRSVGLTLAARPQDARGRARRSPTVLRRRGVPARPSVTGVGSADGESASVRGVGVAGVLGKFARGEEGAEGGRLQQRGELRLCLRRGIRITELQGEPFVGKFVEALEPSSALGRGRRAEHADRRGDRGIDREDRRRAASLRRVAR